MASYQELVKKYQKRQKETLLDSVSAGLSYADNVAVDLGLLDDTGLLGETLETVGAALPFALIAVTEQCKVILGKTDQRTAAENAVYRMAKTGAAMGAGALAFAAGGPVAAIPAAIGVRALLDQYKSKALLGIRVQNRVRRLKALREQVEQRQFGFVPDQSAAKLPLGVEVIEE